MLRRCLGVVNSYSPGGRHSEFEPMKVFLKILKKNYIFLN